MSLLNKHIRITKIPSDLSSYSSFYSIVRLGSVHRVIEVKDDLFKIAVGYHSIWLNITNPSDNKWFEWELADRVVYQKTVESSETGLYKKGCAHGWEDCEHTMYANFCNATEELNIGGMAVVQELKAKLFSEYLASQQVGQSD